MGSHGLRLPDTTRDRLLQFQRRVRYVKIAEGLLAGALGMLLSYLVVFGIDRWIDTPAWVRLALFLTGTIGMTLFLPLKLHRWVWGTRRMEQVAVLLKRRYPALGDQLLGIIELARGDQPLRGSHALAQAAIDQVDAVVKNKDFTHAVPQPRHRLWAKIVAVPAVLALVALAVVPGAGFNTLARWLLPWTGIERYTFARIESLPEQLVVPHGEAFPIAAQLAESTRWSPSSASVRIAGQPEIRVSQNERKYQFEIPPQTDAARLNVRVGDLTAPVNVQVAHRPEMTSLTASVTLPEYLQVDGPRQADVRSGMMSLLKGSAVVFEGEISRALKEATLQNEPIAFTGSSVRTSPVALADSDVLTFQWRDEFGLSSRDGFRLKVNIVEDAAPTISLHQQSPLQVLLTTDVLTFDVQSHDDFGVRKVGLEWQGVKHPERNPEPDRGEKMVAAGGPAAGQLGGTATFSPEQDGVRPQLVELRAFAEDYLPGRARVYSAPIDLYVMTPDQHATWVLQQFRRWVSSADDVYEEELRLLDVNRQLQQMDPQELNSPETRRQIAEQAAAERQNGDRLANVTSHGEALLNQALRNREILAAHLETWAQSLQRLQDISENRMPSVADMLAAAANAPGALPAPPKPGSDGATPPKEQGPEAGMNRGTMSGNPKESIPPEQQLPQGPKLTDIESGFNRPHPEGEKGEPVQKNPSQGGFTLPQTVLQGGPPPSPPQPAAPNDAQQKVEQAVIDQTALLAEFEKVREELQRILADLENSTFVKRLKGASREQLEIATAINRTLFGSFGLNSDDLADHDKQQHQHIAGREDNQSGHLKNLVYDLQAYLRRRPDENFQRILKEMEETEVVAAIAALGEKVREHRSGESIARAEFWADTLDRWAEEMVTAGECKECKGGIAESLPPSIVLELMRILEGEMDLRDQTRSLEQARVETVPEQYRDNARKQSETQEKLLIRTRNVVKDIQALPNAAAFAKEIGIVSLAGDAMRDAYQILAMPDTGPDAVAAETEAIELLLQNKRSNPNGSGGGGGPTPGGGGGGEAERVALEFFGPTGDPLARVRKREVQQASGAVGEQLPAEYREGLDEFMNALENRQ